MTILNRCFYLNTEKIMESEKNADSKSRAEALFDMAKKKISEGNQEEAMLMLMESHSRLKDLEDLHSCFTGELLGQLLFVSGNREDGLRMIRESMSGFREQGFSDEVEKTEQLLAVMEQHAADNPLTEN